MPIGVAGAVALGASAISAGASIYSSSQAAGASKKAQQAAIAAQEKSEAQARADVAPWRETGQNALMATADLSGLNGTEARTNAMLNFQTDPGYQFQQDEGMRAVEASKASAGLLRSGATLNALQTRAQGIADQSFQNYFNRLAGISQQGLGAATGQANTTNTTGAGIAQTEASAGTQQASIYGQQNTAIQQGITNAYSAYTKQNSMYPTGMAPYIGNGTGTTITGSASNPSNLSDASYNKIFGGA